MFSFKRFLLSLCSFVLLAGVGVTAQDFRGSISGRVTEASGAAVNNATVTITNVGTGPVNLDGPTANNSDNLSVQAMVSKDTVFGNAGSCGSSCEKLLVTNSF